MKLLQIIIFFN